MLAVSASALARSSARRRLLDAAAVRHARSRAHVPPKLDSLLWLHDLALLFASQAISTTCAPIDFFVSPSNTGERKRTNQKSEELLVGNECVRTCNSRWRQLT